MPRIILFIFFFSFSFSLFSFQLSENSQISVITIGPSQKELYSAFGHSGIRVKDDSLGIDYFYNYGVFDFDSSDPCLTSIAPLPTLSAKDFAT